MTYRVRRITNEADLLELEDAWTDLLLSAEESTVFASFQWNVAWWRHFGAGAALHVVTVCAGDRLVGLAPLMVRRFGPVRKLEFVATGLSDYGDFLVHPDFERDATGAILAFLGSRGRSWDIADLDEVPAHSPLLRYLSARRSRGLLASLVPQTLCPLIDLSPTWEAYVGSLARKRRYYVSSFPRKFLREQAGALDVVTGGPELEGAVAAFHALHMARWGDRNADLSPEHLHPGFEPFLQETCARLAAMGWLRIASLKAGDQLAASSLNFLLHKRWSGYMKGFDPGWSHARPGTVLDALRIQRAIEEGAQRFDFGRGDESYKSGYGVRVERNTRVLLAHVAPLPVAVYALLMARIRYRTSRAAKSGFGGEDTSEGTDP